MRGWLPSLVSPNSFLDNPLKLYSGSSSGWRKLLSPSITFPFLKLTKGCTLHISSICVREASCTAALCDRQFLSDLGSVTEMGEDYRGMPVEASDHTSCCCPGHRVHRRSVDANIHVMTPCHHITLAVPMPVSLIHAILVRDSYHLPQRHSQLPGNFTDSVCTQLAQHPSMEQNKIKRKEF